MGAKIEDEFTDLPISEYQKSVLREKKKEQMSLPEQFFSVKTGVNREGEPTKVDTIEAIIEKENGE